MNSEFISVKEVAARCCISHVTAGKLLREGRIPGRTLHHGIPRVVRKTFEKWAASEGSRK